MQKIVSLILFTVLFLSGSLPSLASSKHFSSPCASSHTDSQTNNLDNEVYKAQTKDSEQVTQLSAETHEDHESTCHCPIHHSHCCSAHMSLFKPIKAFNFSLEAQNCFDDNYSFSNSAPDLDGPFQPPRA